jgi:hypothetical protein
MSVSGIISSQTKKYAGYIVSGFGGQSNWTSTDGTNDTKLVASSSTWFNPTSIEKMLFVSDTCSLLPVTVSSPQRATAGYANKFTAGYTLGGETAAGVATNKIDRLVFAGETHSTLGTTLAAVVFAFSGAANQTTAGYTFGGFGATVPINTINKMPFSTESNSAISAVLSVARHNTGSISNGPTAIYNGHGIPGNTEIRKLTLSNETMSVLSATLSQTTFNARFGISNVGTSGYFNFYGPSSNSFINSCDKLAYSTETRSTLSTGNNALASLWCGSFANSNIAGYVMGGLIRDGSNRDTVTRINSKMPFATETFSQLNSSMSVWRRQSQGYAYSE